MSGLSWMLETGAGGMPLSRAKRGLDSSFPFGPEAKAPTSVPTSSWFLRTVTAVAGLSGRFPVMSLKDLPPLVERKRWPFPIALLVSPAAPGGIQRRV